MPRPTTAPPETLTFESLYSSPLVSISDYQCRLCQGGPAAEEEHVGESAIVLLRHGVFCRHYGQRTVTSDVNQAVFFGRGSTYRVSHPAPCGDRGTVFAPANAVLLDMIRELDPSIDERPDRPFHFEVGPCGAETFWQHREIVHALEARSAGSREPVEVDLAVLQLLASVLEAAFRRDGSPRSRRQRETDRDHVERVEAVKTYLATRLGDRVALDDVARAVHVSPFHLARLFQRRTGVSIHRYLTKLRLRTSLERLSGGADNLTALALELGFSSHSHFTDTFRAEFARTPSEVRRTSKRADLRQLSKNLEV
jgi:AraC family transcriptional regulator